MQTPKDVMDRDYLETRRHLLEIAATLDRCDHARKGDPADKPDPRLEQIYRSLAVLAERSAATDRSERLLNLFSDPA